MDLLGLFKDPIHGQGIFAENAIGPVIGHHFGAKTFESISYTCVYPIGVSVVWKKMNIEKQLTVKTVLVPATIAVNKICRARNPKAILAE